MKLIVGLGNPGPEYRETRHNVGFLVADELARRWRLSEAWREKFAALHVRTTVADEAVIVAKPLTFMNLSGQAVAGLAGFYKIDPADVLVVTDDVALPLGRLRARPEGSAGGHNGLKSIIQHLGTQAFPRVRVGIGRGDDVTKGHRRELSDHVLGRFEPAEHDTVLAAVLRAADASERFLSDGIERVMSAFNAAEKQDPGPA
ncbi:MAG: aminoacyl-tRNA hydrolase [Acidobacteriota bacterium]|nr:aminoacyl-tRNA hydrolase [Acidobacteriota bacterium]